MALTHALACAWSILCIFNYVSSNESGSGSGVLAPDCPSTPILVNITRPINTEFLTQVLLTRMSFPTPDNRSVSITQIELRPVAVNYRVPEGDVTVQTNLTDDGNLTLTVVGDLVSATAVIVDIWILDEDGMMIGSSSCMFSIQIAVLNRMNCVVEESSRISDDTQLLRFYAITLTLDIPVADFNSTILTQIAIPIVRILNSVCLQDCNRCGMAGSCSLYLQFCQEFSVTDIELYDAPKAGLTVNNRLVRRAITTTVINLVVRHPTGVPPSGFVALVPPLTSLSALTDALQSIENTTGITVLDANTLIPSSNIITTTLFAHIILPIMIILFVLILVIGVIIVVVIGKNKSKKSKIRPLLSSTSS